MRTPDSEEVGEKEELDLVEEVGGEGEVDLLVAAHDGLGGNEGAATKAVGHLADELGAAGGVLLEVNAARDLLRGDLLEENEVVLTVLEESEGISREGRRGGGCERREGKERIEIERGDEARKMVMKGEEERIGKERIEEVR